MHEVQIYRRRPSCLVRYRHGGFSSVFPMAHRYDAVNILAAKSSARASTSDAGARENVLAFPERGDIAKRPQTPRMTRRPNSRPPKGRSNT
jgi:hypothetical protein